jgi:hypothetical protein
MTDSDDKEQSWTLEVEFEDKGLFNMLLEATIAQRKDERQAAEKYAEEHECGLLVHVYEFHDRYFLLPGMPAGSVTERYFNGPGE